MEYRTQEIQLDNFVRHAALNAQLMKKGVISCIYDGRTHLATLLPLPIAKGYRFDSELPRCATGLDVLDVNARDIVEEVVEDKTIFVIGETVDTRLGLLLSSVYHTQLVEHILAVCLQLRTLDKPSA